MSVPERAARLHVPDAVHLRAASTADLREMLVRLRHVLGGRRMLGQSPGDVPAVTRAVRHELARRAAK